MSAYGFCLVMNSLVTMFLFYCFYQLGRIAGAFDAADILEKKTNRERRAQEQQKEFEDNSIRDNRHFYLVKGKHND